MEVTSPPEGSRTRVGRYEVLEPLASGGMADLFLARAVGPEGFEKRCVLKKARPKGRAGVPSYARLLSEEARVAARFEHPNLVQVFELGEDTDGLPFVAMEYVAGLDLRALGDLARERGVTVPPALAIWIIAQAADGLAYAHGFQDAEGEPLGIVHRDVSPHNILVSWEGATKVVDFGVAVSTARAGAEAALGAGKLPYMAPEQIEGRPVDARADIFSLGVCAFELLCGRRPFEGETAAQVARAIVEAPPPLLEPACPEASPELAVVIGQALHKEAEDRYPTARGFARALRDVLRSAAAPVERHVLAEFMRALREGTPDRFDRSRHALPRPAGGLPYAGPDPYAAFAPGAGFADEDPFAGTEWAKERTPMPTPPPSPPRRSRAPSRGPAVGLAVLVAGLVVLVGVLLSRRSAEPTVDPAAPPVSEAAPAAALAPPLTAPPSSPEAADPRSELEPAVAAAPEPARAPAADVSTPASSPSRAEAAPPPAQAARAPSEPARARTAPLPERVARAPSEPARAPIRARRSPPAQAAREPSEPARAPSRARTGPLPEQAARAPSPAPAALSRLTLRTEPSGLPVRIDGKRVGNSPVDVRLSAGPHDVRVGGTREVPARKTRLELPAGSAVVRKLEFRKGRLRFITRPWARVWVGEHDYGVTPATLDLYEGRHRIRLVTESGKTVDKTVVVEPGRETVHRLKLE